MIEKLDGSDWNNIQTVINGTDNLYLYKFTKSGKSIWVAWWDYFLDPSDKTVKTVTLSFSDIKTSHVLVTDALPAFNGDFQTRTNRLNETDYPRFFPSRTLPVINGRITLTLDDAPVFVEEKWKD